MEMLCASFQLASTPLFQFQHFPQFSVLRLRNPTQLHTRRLVSCNSRSNNEKAEERAQSTNRLFIFGIGFVAKFFAETLKNDNWEVSGTCTNAVKKTKLKEIGLDAEIFEANDSELRCLNSLVDATHILVCIPPVINFGDPVLYQHLDLLLSGLNNRNLQWLGYLSSTSVYGDCGGAWVDEDYPAKPTKDSAKARLIAEKGWLSLGHDLGVSVQVFRLGGIYGPGRSALDTVIKQQSLSESQRMREARHYTSRVHVADICQALKASINMPSPGRIYNVVDDEPAPRVEVFQFARALIDQRWPGCISDKHSSNTSGSVSQEITSVGEKRVLNERLKNELGVRLLHPTYRSGLENIIKSMEGP